MKKKDFLSVRDFDQDAIVDIFTLASRMKAAPETFSDALKGKTLAMIFEKPSLRTRASFDIGIQQLGGFSLVLLPMEINLGKRESVHDVAKNLERMAQGIMIRTFAHEIVVDMAKYASIPVINALTDYSHPCQAMADLMTVMELKKELKGLKICFVGDGNNVAHSLMFAGARLGVHVSVACPEGYDPNRVAFQNAVEDAKFTGARIEVTHNPADGVRNADVVYTDVWASMGQEAEAEARKTTFRCFQVNADLMAKAKKDAVFMHCLPAHRGEEVTQEVIDGTQSVVFQQAENRLHVQKAIMYKLMK